MCVFFKLCSLDSHSGDCLSWKHPELCVGIRQPPHFSPFPTRDILSGDLRWFRNHHLMSVFRWRIGTWQVWVLLCVYWHSVKLEWCSQTWTKLISMVSSKHHTFIYDRRRATTSRSFSWSFGAAAVWGPFIKCNTENPKYSITFTKTTSHIPKSVIRSSYFGYSNSENYCHESALVSWSTVVRSVSHVSFQSLVKHFGRCDVIKVWFTDWWIGSTAQEWSLC